MSSSREWGGANQPNHRSIVVGSLEAAKFSSVVSSMVMVCWRALERELRGEEDEMRCFEIFLDVVRGRLDFFVYFGFFEVLSAFWLFLR